jgi:hypothetical protein
MILSHGHFSFRSADRLVTLLFISMKLRRHPLLAAVFMFFLTGCAHYYLPASQLESPEAVGPDRVGRLELAGIQSGTDLMIKPTPGSPDPTTGAVPDPSLSMTPANYVFGAWVSLNPKLDLGVRFSPFAPPVVRIKYQVYGEPESTAQVGNWSASLNGTGGFLFGSLDGVGVTFYTATAAVIGGYRFAEHHVASLAPFFNLAGISGVGTASGSGNRLGASLGYQYDIESLLLRAELTWATGSVSQTAGSAKMGGFFPGALVGFKL